MTEGRRGRKDPSKKKRKVGTQREKLQKKTICIPYGISVHKSWTLEHGRRLVLADQRWANIFRVLVVLVIHLTLSLLLYSL